MLTIKRVPDYEKEISRLRAANKKLRAEVQKATHSASVYKEASKNNLETMEMYRRDVSEAMNVGGAWKEAFSKLAEAISGKAK